MLQKQESLGIDIYGGKIGGDIKGPKIGLDIKGPKFGVDVPGVGIQGVLENQLLNI